MKKWPVLAVTAGVVVAGLTVTPAVAADPAPTNVKIDWKDDTFQAIHVTWEEDSPRPNEVRVEGLAGSGLWDTFVSADGPNEVDIPKAVIGTGPGAVRIAVAVGTPAERTSPKTLTPKFDTELAGVPQLVSVTQSGALLTVKWQLPTTTDSTPDDPLDRPDALKFVPQYEVGGKTTALAPAWPDKQVSFTNPVPSYVFSVRSQNEWGGGQTGAKVNVRSAKLTATVPSRGAYGAQALIQGSYGHPVQRQVVLQARNSATAAWYVVGTTVGNSSGGYSFRVTNRGTRQYRVATAGFISGAEVWYGATTGTATTTTTHLASAKFYTPTLKRGQTATADLNVDPRFSGRVALQRWNGSTWVHVKDVLINQGFARGTFVSTAVGRVAYRYYVPTITYNGLQVAAAYSPNFVLTTNA